MKFREDVNCLRAIAVIGVVIFHFNPNWLPGGFSGVDVFFVISGYLMTNLIFTKLSKKEFSLIDFYSARANRIIPALFFLCLVLLIWGWFYLNPIDYKSLAKHVGSSVGFVSNFIFWSESGYFDVTSQEKWLLHTWSLSVEWQFYMIWPLILIFFAKLFSLQNVKYIVLCMTVLAFFYSLYSSLAWPNSSYYLLPARAWEMMIGGVAFFFPFNVKRNKYVQLIGLCCILLSYFIISKDTYWPGYAALLPVLGSYLIISCKSNNILLSNAFIKKTGRYSYSIYLWHWPIVVFVSYYSLPEYFIYLGILLSYFLGAFSYTYIEDINIKRSKSLISFFYSIPILLIVFLIFLSVYIFSFQPNKYLNSMPSSITESFTRKDFECFDKEFHHLDENPFCKIGKGDIKVFSTGDSHSYSVLPALEALSEPNVISLTYTGYSGCPPLAGISVLRQDQYIRNCYLLNNKVFKHIQKFNYDYIMLAARWTYYTEGNYFGEGLQRISHDNLVELQTPLETFRAGIKETLKQLSTSDSKVILMLQVPYQNMRPQKAFYRALSDDFISIEKLKQNSVKLEKHLRFQKATNEIIRNEASIYKNVLIVDPKDIFCDEKICLFGDSTHSYYYDEGHLSIEGSLKLSDTFRKIFENESF